MKSPFTGKEMSASKEWRTMVFRKEEFEILFHFYKCDDTGEQFEDEDFAELNYNQLVNQFRTKHSIPFPDQIITIRKKYGIPATKMSEILGFGANVYRQYESGEVPNQSNARLIQLIEDPHEFKKLVDLNNVIDQKMKNKIYNTIGLILDHLNKSKTESLLESYFFKSLLPSRFSGFKKPDINKFAEMVVFFTKELQPWKTKLNKLLFYADFLSFKHSGFSISGMQYRAISMGPVPVNFNSIFEYLSNNRDVEVLYTGFPDGNIGEQFMPIRKFNPDVFTKRENSMLEAIAERFKNLSTNEIIALSHQEKAWIENQAERKIIDYIYSFELAD